MLARGRTITTLAWRGQATHAVAGQLERVVRHRAKWWRAQGTTGWRDWSGSLVEAQGSELRALAGKLGVWRGRRACAAAPRDAASFVVLWTATTPAHAALACWYVTRPVRRRPVLCAAKTSPKLFGEDNAGARECAAKGRGRRAERDFGGLRCLTFELRWRRRHGALGRRRKMGRSPSAA